MRNTLRIATRKSPLARWQADHVAALIKKHLPDLTIDILPLTTTGDRLLGVNLQDQGGKGLFIKELEEALLRKDADIAVHSMKDVPVSLPASLLVQPVLPREDPADAFVSNRYSSLAALPANARIGTSSLRRWCQIRHFRPEITCLDLRGNLDTRLRQLDEGHFDAIILACAGLKRLGYATRICERIPYTLCLPAVGQGVLGVEYRADDLTLHEQLKVLNHLETSKCVESERAVSRLLGGNCRLPIAAFACMQNNQIHLRARVGSPDGKTLLNTEAYGSNPQVLSLKVANALQEQGAKSLIEGCH